MKLEYELLPLEDAGVEDVKDDFGGLLHGFAWSFMNLALDYVIKWAYLSRCNNFELKKILNTNEFKIFGLKLFMELFGRLVF